MTSSKQEIVNSTSKLEVSNMHNIVSLCTPPDLGKIDNFTTTAYLVKKYQECKEQEQNYEVVISKLNTTIKSNFYQVFHDGINRKWPDSYIQSRESDYERLVLTNDGKEAYTKKLYMLDLNYKIVTNQQKEAIIQKENDTIISDYKENGTKRKESVLAPGKVKKAKKDERLVVTLSCNFKDEPNYNDKIQDGIVVETNRWDQDLLQFIQNLDKKTRWYEYNEKKWIIKGQTSMDHLLAYIKKKEIAILDNRKSKTALKFP